MPFLLGGVLIVWHSVGPKLYGVLAVLHAVGFKERFHSFRVDLFLKGIVVHGSKEKVTKVVSFQRVGALLHIKHVLKNLLGVALLFCLVCHKHKPDFFPMSEAAE